MYEWMSSDSKWEVINNNGVLRVFRHGEEMYNMTDNLHLAMIQEIEDLNENLRITIENEL